MNESNLLGGENLRYQQLYKGIPVVDGGFTIRIIPNDPTAALSNQSEDPFGPCGRLAALSLNVYEEIDVNTNPNITTVQVQDSLQGIVLQVDSIELKIINNILGYCDYRLVYEVQYSTFEEGELVGLLDAHSGEILHTTSRHNNKNAPTNDFGTQFLNDQIVGNITVLRNGRLTAHDMTGVTEITHPTEGNIPVLRTRQLNNSFDNDQIPESPITRDWNCINQPPVCNDAPANVFQAFWMTDQVIDAFEIQLGIVFQDVHIGIHPTAEGATSFDPGLPNTRANFAFGVLDNNSTVEYDVIAHELGHSIIREFFSSGKIEGGSLHEAIADMFGTYIESFLDLNELDWAMGDDIPFVVRDLQNTALNCFDDVVGITNSPHDRSEALGHWFFLCVNGDVNTGIPPMDLDEVMTLVYEALPNLAENPDYPDLMEVTMDLTARMYGTCSDQFLTILRAWEQICVPTGHRMANPSATCLILEGDISVCEVETEYDDDLQVCLSAFHGLDTDKGRWTIIGPQNTSFTSLRGMTGNSQYGGQCIKLTQFPIFPYYPQRITIQYWNPEYGDFLTRNVIIRDCYDNHLSCEEYFDIEPLANDGNSYEAFMNSIEAQHFSEQISDKELKLKVYDMMGNELNINEDQINFQNFGQPRIIILTYWDIDGKLIKSKKKLIR